jgi:hypothetical protein
MSVLETLYSGDSILLIFPDGTGPALLCCLIGGIPLNRVHELNFLSGDIQNVDFGSVNTIASQTPPQYYSDIIQRGRHELKRLRENPDTVLNVKDLKFEEELKEKRRLELEERQAREERRMKEEQQNQRQVRKIDTGSIVDTGSIGMFGVICSIGIGLAAISLGHGDTQSSLNETLVDVTAVIEDDSEVSLSDDFNAEETLNSAHSQQIAAEIPSENSSAITIDSRNDMDVDDWGDAWLGTINDIINENSD